MSEDIYADFYDFAVTDIAFVTLREPNPHWHTPTRAFVNPWSHILVYAMSGAADYEVTGQRYAIEQGDMLFFPKGMPHTGRSVPDNPWSFINVGFDTASTSGDAMSQLSSLRTFWRGVFTDQLSSLFTELHVAWSDKKPGYLIRCRGIVMTVLYTLIREQTLPHLYSPHAQKIVSLISMMRANHREFYSVSGLASLVGLSQSHFRALFKAFTGLTVKEYQHRIKISKAKELLLSGECNVTEAAVRTGFQDIYYFSRLFKKVTGTNPSEFTKR